MQTNWVLTSLVMASLIGVSGVASARKKRDKPPEPVVADWKKVATPHDMDRIRNWRTAFIKAVENARVRGSGGTLDREGELLAPDASLGGAAPPAGEYRCRVIKLGSNTPARPAFVTYPPYPCTIADEGEVKSFAKSGGAQRPVGLIFTNDSYRAIFLGTMMIGDERRAIDYGSDSRRDMAGAVERIGPARWRMILPYPGFESVMDVIELTPAA